MTESSPETKPKRAARTRKLVSATSPEPAHRHPSLGHPPLDVTAGFPDAADVLRRDRADIAAAALRAVLDRDPEFRDRFGEVGLRQLLADAEVLIGRLAYSVTSGDPRPMADYAEWIDPMFRRRRVSLWDLSELCMGIREVAARRVGPEAAGTVAEAMDAAIAVLRKNGRLGGDVHERNALLKWFYRGV